VIKRAKLLSIDKCITADLLGIELSKQVKKNAIIEVTEQDIVSAIKQSSGVIADAARALGLSRSALYRRMKKFNI